MLERIRDAHVAQLAEHVLGKDEVTRSIRVVGSILYLLGKWLSKGSNTKNLKFKRFELDSYSGGGDGEVEI